jgi:hypothetical protein
LSRLRQLFIVLVLLPFASSLNAATEHLLAEARLRGPWEARAVFIGETYLVVWTNPGPDDTASEHWLARVDEAGRLLGPPVQVARGVRGIPRFAATRNSALLAFVEAVPPVSRSLPPHLRVSLLWLDGQGVQVGNATVIDFEDETTFAVDLAATSSGYVLAVGGRSPRALSIREFASPPFASVSISDREAGYVSIGASQNSVFLITQGSGNPFPCGGCGPPPAEGRMFDHALNRVGRDPDVEGPGNLAGDRDGYVLMTHDHRSLRLTRMDSAGRKTASRDRFFIGSGFRQIAQSGDKTIVAWNRGSDLYFALYDPDLRPVGLADGQAFSISATFRMENLYALAAGTRKFLALYTTTLTDPSGPELQPRALAYQVIDLDALPLLRSAPWPPIAVSASSEFTATVGFQWHAVAGAVRYHLQAITADGTDARDVVVGADATLVRFEFMLAGAEYRVRLLVEDEHGLSAPSEALTVHTPARYTAKRRSRGVRR